MISNTIKNKKKTIYICKCDRCGAGYEVAFPKGEKLSDYHTHYCSKCQDILKAEVTW